LPLSVGHNRPEEPRAAPWIALATILVISLLLWAGIVGVVYIILPWI
jgi:hypothetical protein